MEPQVKELDDPPPQTQVPDWESPLDKRNKSRFQIPQRRSINVGRVTGIKSRVWTGTYRGYQRRTLCIILTIVLLLLLALVLGLGIGLSKRHSSQFLPLPSDKQSFTGDLTYYATGLGACGVTSSDSDNIVSVSHFLFDAVQQGSNPNANPLCGLKIRAERFDQDVGGQRSVDLAVVDRCTGCKPTDLDVSIGVFQQLADPVRGRVTVTWAWLSPTPTPQ